MKDKLFQSLKQKYSNLGLGDDVLQVHAESLIETGIVNVDNIESVVSAQKNFLEKLQSEMDRRAANAASKAKASASKEIDELKQQMKTPPNGTGDKPDWYVSEKAAMDKVIQELIQNNKKTMEDFGSLKKEYNNLLVQKAVTERKNFVESKAKELGIPQYRIDEGFVIDESADEKKIVDYLTKISNNIKASQLPSNRDLFPMADGKVEKSDTDAIAKSLVR